MQIDFEGIIISEKEEEEPITLTMVDTPKRPSNEITLPSASPTPIERVADVVIPRNHLSLLIGLSLVLAIVSVSLVLVVLTR